jgi:hypothetical protein
MFVLTECAGMLGRRRLGEGRLQLRLLHVAYHFVVLPRVISETNGSRLQHERDKTPRHWQVCQFGKSADAQAFDLNNIFMVPPERIELPTFGLQNRCSTAELQGHARRLAYLARQ